MQRSARFARLDWRVQRKGLQPNAAALGPRLCAAGRVRAEWRGCSMRTLRRTLTWGRCPQTPGIFRFSARMDLFWGAGCARPRPIPAAESALGLRSRSALSSTQVLPEWTTSNSPGNTLLSTGDHPLNTLSHSKGSLHTHTCLRVPPRGRDALDAAG